MRVLSLAFMSGTLAASVLALSQAGTAEATSASSLTPLQVMADITLIDAHCRNVSVNFGALFRYGEDHGIESISVMPLGSRRKAFEAAMASRLASAAPAELCSEITAQDDEAAPGVIRRP